jgi:hypothetical protein
VKKRRRWRMRWNRRDRDKWVEGGRRRGGVEECIEGGHPQNAPTDSETAKNNTPRGWNRMTDW